MESWKDIKPLRNYNDIKKKAFIDQKKRDFQEMRKNDKEKNSDAVTVGYKRPKYYTEGNKNFSPQKLSSNPIENEKDAFKQKMVEKKRQMKNMTPEELEKMK